jgi:uncharacterized protein
MRIIRAYFFHGLESELPSSKVDIMEQMGWEVGSDLMKYKSGEPYKLALEKVKKFKPDILVGSSLGGLTARYLSSYLDIPVILLNPAFPFKDYNMDFPDRYGEFIPKAWVLLGAKDATVDFRQNKKEMESYGACISVDDHGHRTPKDIFKAFLESILNDIQVEIDTR